mgnify:CR=1 FL=1
MFYISAIGHSASLWLSTALTTHPDIVCWHGNRSIPPYDSGSNDLSEEDFDLVWEWFDKEGLDITTMLDDEIVFDNPKAQAEFDAAMNGHPEYV